MAGVILVTCRRKGKPNLIWRAATLRYCLMYYAVKGLRSLTHSRCSQTRRDCCVWSRIQKAYAIVSGGAGSNATAVWAAKLGMNLQSSTLKDDETGEPFHIQQAKQIRAYRQAGLRQAYPSATRFGQPQYFCPDGRTRPDVFRFKPQ